MRNYSFFLILAGLMLALDIYVYQTVKFLASPKYKTLIVAIFWGLSIACFLLVATAPITNFTNWPLQLRNIIFAIIMAIFIGKFTAACFFIIDDLRRLIHFIGSSVFFKNTEGETMGQDGISRSHFLSWLGVAVGGGLLTTLVVGFKNKYNYQVKKVDLFFDDLPDAFNGFKIVQLSDIHSGSFTDKTAVARGVTMANELKPDVIFFTGDLVNDRATEIEPYIDVFNKLQAPMGVYSVLGNHDYGDYVTWQNLELKKNNLEALKKHHASMNWKLLLNENQLLTKQNQSIRLIGIENWGNGRFAKYGNMQAATQVVDAKEFQILLSHDPSHWEAQVQKEYPNVNLMLSGHTHGMQFGVEIPGIKWSPVQWRYKQWGGAYSNEQQQLYVNTGFGFIGYPGRVGILPEITEITLRKKV
jgi:uncharacterized protein